MRPRQDWSGIRLMVGLLLGTGLWLFSGGCLHVSGTPPALLNAGVRVVVGPVNLESPLPDSSQLYTFTDDPPAEIERDLVSQLVDDIQTKAQRYLTEQLRHQTGLDIVPFQKTRRVMADLASPGTPFTAEQIDALAAHTGADIVVTGLIHDYGKVRWQYWATGWLAHITVATTLVGVATAWNPIALGTYLAIDASTDFPLWYGGAQIFGWAFRPVRVHAEAVQIRHCRGVVWSEDELATKVPGKTLAEYPPEQQSRKDIQLEVNLKRVMADIAKTLGPKLAMQPCQADGTPAKISTFSLWSVFDLLY